jgi:hypothetical protein
VEDQNIRYLSDAQVMLSDVTVAAIVAILLLDVLRAVL